jgi:hypothetical protein
MKGGKRRMVIGVVWGGLEGNAGRYRGKFGEEVYVYSNIIEAK